MSRIEDRLRELSIVLPVPAAALGSYVDVVITGNLAFVSGKLPVREEGGLLFKGKLGVEVTVEDGYGAAELCARHVLACVRAAVGDLDRVARIVRVGGYVAAGPGFIDAPKVVNGASDFFIKVFGDAGRHSRAAIGVASLPLDAPVEIDAIFEILP